MMEHLPNVRLALRGLWVLVHLTLTASITDEKTEVQRVTSLLGDKAELSQLTSKPGLE